MHLEHIGKVHGFLLLERVSLNEMNSFFFQHISQKCHPWPPLQFFSRSLGTATVGGNTIIETSQTRSTEKTAAFVILSHTCCMSSSIFPASALSRDLNISGGETEMLIL